MEHYAKAQQIEDLKEMIEADRGHLQEALNEARYKAAQRYLQAIIDSQATLDNLIG